MTNTKTKTTTKILIVRIGALGDGIHTLPLVNAIRRNRPDWQIDWFAGGGIIKYLDGHAAVNNFVPVKKTVAGYLDAYKRIKGQYDIAIDTQGLIKSAVFARASAPKVVGRAAGFARERPAAWFYTDPVIPTSVNIIDQNMDLLSALDIDDRRVEFNISIHPKPDWPLLEKKPVLLNVGGGWWTKLWNPEKFASLARKLEEKNGVPVGVIWGPGEEEAAQKVCEQSSAELAPKTTFAELGACFSAARLLVSGETGPLHLAAAVGCPTVGLFGPTSSKRNGCHGEGHQIVEPELHCRPCYGRTCADFQCMPMIEVEQVYRAVEKLL